MVKAFRCAPAGVSVADQWRSAAWMVGGSIVLISISLMLQQQIGRNAFSESLSVLRLLRVADVVDASART